MQKLLDSFVVSFDHSIIQSQLQQGAISIYPLSMLMPGQISLGFLLVGFIFILPIHETEANI